MRPLNLIPGATVNAHYFAAAGALILFLLMGLGMAWTKAPWCDEGWFGSAAYHFANHGRLIIPEIEGAPDDPKMMRSADHIYWNVPLYEVWQGAVAKVFGFSLFKARVSSLLWGLAALVAWTLVVRRLAGSGAAFVTVLLLSVDYTFVLKAPDVRMDIMSAALGALAILSYLRYREHRLPKALLISQAFVTLSFLTHPNGGLLAFFDTAALAVYFDRRRLRPQHLGAVAAPYVAGGLGWGLYLIQDFALAQVQLGGNASGRFAGVLAPISALRQEIVQRYLQSFGWAPEAAGLARLKVLLLAGYAAGAIGAVFTARRVKRARPLVMLAAIHAGFLTFFDATKQGAYFAHIIPLLVILLAVWIVSCWTSRPGWRPALVLGVAAFCLLQLAASAHSVFWKPGKADYLEVVRFLDQNAARSDLIVGPAELRFGLGFERPLSDDHRLGYYSKKQPEFVVVDRVYQRWFEHFRKQRPPIYAHIQLVLTTYPLVFRNGSYNIYARPEKQDAAQTAQTESGKYYLRLRIPGIQWTRVSRLARRECASS
jgi:4-amino-4-deoxy-L-arabinose transferase-like glycosyltransferase